LSFNARNGPRFASFPAHLGGCIQANLDLPAAFRYKDGTVGTTSLPAPGRPLVRAPRRLLALRTDDVLVERIRAGDLAAFEVLYARHVPGVLAFCRHMLGDADEAEDAVQTAFASAHRSLTSGDREVNFKPWLYTIARNRCVSILRARREHAEAEPDLQTAGLSEEVQRRSDLRELVADLHDLPQDQRAALVLSELGDLSQAEVAEVLGCGVSNVKGLVFRARSGLTERRDARDASCEEIRVELASARRGGLRRGRLRHHLKACPGCSAYLDDLRRQRKMLALALPVVPSLGLRDTVLAATGLGGAGAGAAGGGVALLGSGSTIAKVAVMGALAGGAGVAAPSAIDRVSGDSGSDAAPDGRDAGEKAPGARAVPSPAVPAVAGANEHSSPSGPGRKVRRRGAGTPGADAPGHTRAPGRGRSGAAKGVGKAKGQGKPSVTSRPAPRARRPVVPPGKTREPTRARGAPALDAPSPRSGPKLK
jgi:RNA polymerase sigma factor (sigma-70 family)